MSTLHPQSGRSRPSSRRSRPPLLELPLDHFLIPPNPASKLGSSTKRPVSPGTPVLYSPAKRRILNEEGLSTMKSPLSAPAFPPSAAASSSKQSFKTPQLYQQNTTRFADALVGPDSPARKLDFGMPKNVATGSRTPSRRSEEERAQRLAPSPEIKARPQSRLGSLEAEDGSFPTQPPQTQPQLQLQSQALFSSPPSLAETSSHPQFLTVPRELPPPIDPQSEHYPGFAVYQDPHYFLPTLRLSSPAPLPTPASILTPLDNSIDIDSDSDSIDVRELVKENLPPRRKPRKATAPTPEKHQLFSPPSAKSSSVPATPPRDFQLKDRDLLTPRRLSIFGVSAGPGPGNPRSTPSKEDRRAMRKILEEEVDGDD